MELGEAGIAAYIDEKAVHNDSGAKL